ncbi:hypothetical protein T484DRAFT_1901150 [Baffinella frigidus]|nr:hypothetical protein T484DRAFT_1901150 [Cryptophyta sp. CCMP2293]
MLTSLASGSALLEISRTHTSPHPARDTIQHCPGPGPRRYIASCSPPPTSDRQKHAQEQEQDAVAPCDFPGGWRRRASTVVGPVYGCQDGGGCQESGGSQDSGERPPRPPPPGTIVERRRLLGRHAAARRCRHVACRAFPPAAGRRAELPCSISVRHRARLIPGIKTSP